MAKSNVTQKEITHPSQRDESKYVDRVNMVLDFRYESDDVCPPGQRKRSAAYRLTPNAHHVLMILAARVDQDSAEHDRTYVGVDYLSERSRLAPSAVSAALAELTDKEIIRRETRINNYHSKFSVINWDTLRASHYPMSEKRQKAWEAQERAKRNAVGSEPATVDDLSDLDDLDVEIKPAPASKPLPRLVKIVQDWLPHKLKSPKQIVNNVTHYESIVLDEGGDLNLFADAVDWLANAEDLSEEMVKVRELISAKNVVVPVCHLGYKREQIQAAYAQRNENTLQPQTEGTCQFAPIAGLAASGNWEEIPY